MIKLNIQPFFKESGKSRYWLARQLGTSGQNLNRMLRGETKAIYFETLDGLCQIFECSPNDLLIYVPDEKRDS